MKKDTKEKLKKLGLQLGNKYGHQSITRNDFFQLCKLENQNLNLNLHVITIKKYSEWLKNFISRLRYDLFFNPGQTNCQTEQTTEHLQVIDTLEELVKPILDLKDIKNITITYKSGDVKEFSNPEPEPKKWSGLFDYREDGPYIRTGRYTGCNVHSSKSLKQYFTNNLDLYSFVVWCLSPRVLNMMSNTRDEQELEMNIRTLTELKEKIEFRSQFPTTLKQIRRKKGFEI